MPIRRAEDKAGPDRAAVPGGRGDGRCLGDGRFIGRRSTTIMLRYAADRHGQPARRQFGWVC